MVVFLLFQNQKSVDRGKLSAIANLERGETFQTLSLHQSNLKCFDKGLTLKMSAFKICCAGFTHSTLISVALAQSL